MPICTVSKILSYSERKISMCICRDETKMYVPPYVGIIKGWHIYSPPRFLSDTKKNPRLQNPNITNQYIIVIFVLIKRLFHILSYIIKFVN
jgi:hypothetical protein